MKTLTKEDMKMFLDLDVKFSTGTIINPDYKFYAEPSWRNELFVKATLVIDPSAYRGPQYKLGVMGFIGSSHMYPILLSTDIDNMWRYLRDIKIKKLWSLGSRNNQFKLDYIGSG